MSRSLAPLVALAIGACATAPPAPPPAAAPPPRQPAPAASAHDRRQGTVQFVSGTEDFHQPTTEAVIRERLDKMLADIPAHASAPRIALSDIKLFTLERAEEEAERARGRKREEEEAEKKRREDEERRRRDEFQDHLRRSQQKY